MIRARSSRIVVRRRRAAREEGGYVVVVSTLLIVVLLGMVALALDVAVLYARTQEVQRTADAAALAGVAYLPRTDIAITKAIETAERNGFTASASIDVNAGTDPLSPRRLKVTITDHNVPSFFGGMFTNGLSVSRTAVAEYFAKIPLGSAYNSIGTGDLAASAPTPSGKQGFWLAAGGFCTAKEDGDALLSRYDGTRPADLDVGLCGPQGGDPPQRHLNTEYNPGGYDYLVTVPCAAPGVMGSCPGGAGYAVQVYDPIFDPTSEINPGDTRIDYRNLNFVDEGDWNSVRVTTTFASFPADWTTPYDRSDDIAITTNVYGTCLSSPCPETGRWVTLFNVPANQYGTWRVNVSTAANEAMSFGTNAFALRAVALGTPSPIAHGPSLLCSSLLTPTCPSISGESTMGVYANAPASATGGQVEFFLAKLAPARDFRGKRVKVTLWDPGEGALKLEILPPGGGAPTPFEWRTWYPGLTRLDGTAILDEAAGWTAAGPISATEIDVSGTVLLPTPDNWDASTRAGSDRFNDRNVSVELTIPTNYGLDGAGNEVSLADAGWWKIRYTTAAGVVTDRTTWSLELLDEPVHLVG